MATITHLQRSQINDAKWNACMATAGNGLVYGYTFYLDAMCSNWNGIIVNDYEAVFPLPWRQKYTIKYVYHPFGVAQLGLFGNSVTQDLLHEVLKKIPSTFWYLDVPLNFGNHFLGGLPYVVARKNYVLNLANPYETLFANYRQQQKRNIKKAAARCCIVQKNIAIETVIALAKTQKANTASAPDFERFKNLYALLSKKGWATTYGVFSEPGQILASAVFFFANERAYYILAGNSAEGRTAGASHYLIDAFIKHHAGQQLVLDFEGSDVPTLQFFYSSFGAVNEPYAALRLNRLPFVLKWLK